MLHHVRGEERLAPVVQARTQRESESQESAPETADSPGSNASAPPGFAPEPADTEQIGCSGECGQRHHPHAGTRKSTTAFITRLSRKIELRINPLSAMKPVRPSPCSSG